ncbi:hypothetical protein ZYGR_0P00130 [Zygosaccharomyces rouxii]|uniref:Uncharacterized protein n=1 Tax=Zygosaccharomyces rouxii TaxID=4956 RepID=A0A1Q3A127_ZYGRO|nr:hypothetical protein ZYGR_0P00130 [Zygosaccharomyces rouxii]
MTTTGIYRSSKHKPKLNVEMPTGHGEGDPILPVYSFRNSFTWTLHEASRNSPLIFALPFLLGIALASFGRKVAICLIVIGLLMIILADWPPLHKNYVLSQNKELFSTIVLAVDPGVEATKWREAASKMNTALYEQGFWKTLNFFFNEKECRDGFREHVLKLLPSSEASKRYRQAISKLFMSFLDDVPSEFDILPRYRFYEYFSNKCFMFGVLMLAISSAIGIPDEAKRTMYSIYAYNTVMYLYGAIQGKQFSFLDVVPRVKFLATIMHFAPGSDISKWDEIAGHMNYYLSSKKDWDIPRGCFSEGKDCLNFYKTAFEPLINRNKRGGYLELGDIVLETNKLCGKNTKL